jgi:hypothetical protein
MLFAVIVLSLVSDSPLDSCNAMTVDSQERLSGDLNEDSANLTKNLFWIARCEANHPAFQVARHKEVAECSVWRIGWMNNSGEFSSGNLAL